jgi:hypothetical protein
MIKRKPARTFESRKLTLEQRIARLENMIKNERQNVTRRARKFESMGISDCKAVYDLVSDACELHNAASYFDGFDEDTCEYEFSIANILDDQEYADDWETNDETFSVTCEPDNTLTVRLVSSNFSGPQVLGSGLRTPKQAANAIIKYRF